MKKSFKDFYESSGEKVWKDKLLLDYLATFLDIVSELALSRSLPFRLSAWKIKLSSPPSKFPDFYLKRNIFDDSHRERNVAKLLNFFKKGCMIPVSSIFPIPRTPSSSLPGTQIRLYDRLFLEYTPPTSTLESNFGRIENFYILPPVRCIPKKEDNRFHIETPKSPRYDPSLVQRLHILFGEAVLTEKRREGRTKIEISSREPEWHFNWIASRVLSEIRLLALENTKSRKESERNVPERKELQMDEESLAFWMWKEFNFLRIREVRSFGINTGLFWHDIPSIPPPAELLWRYRKFDFCFQVLSKERKLVDIVKEKKLEKCIPRWYRILIGCEETKQSEQKKKIDKIKVEQEEQEQEEENTKEILWLFEKDFFLPKPGEWDFDPVTGKNHPVVDLLFYQSCKSFFFRFSYFRKKTERIDFHVMLKRFSEVGVKVNFHGWDYDEKSGENHPTIKKIMLLFQKCENSDFLFKSFSSIKINLKDIKFSDFSFQKAAELKLAWKLTDFKTLILSLPDLETAYNFLQKFGHGKDSKICNYREFKNQIAQDKCSIHSSALSGSDIETLAHKIISLLSQKDMEERLKEVEALWKQKSLMKEFQAIKRKPHCSVEEGRKNFSWKGDPTKQLVHCLFHNDFHAFLTFLPFL